MSDLISRSQLLKEIETWGGCVDALHDYIQNMPTAYDIDKVIKNLNEWTFNANIDVGDGTVMNHNLIVRDVAIDIVKAGGENDD
jgi:hypothetical protein